MVHEVGYPEELDIPRSGYPEIRHMGSTVRAKLIGKYQILSL